MMHADLASSGRAVRVLRYEDLVRSTEPTLRAMLRFLEIDDVDSNRIDCARCVDDPSVKRIKKRSATELMAPTPGLACGLWRQISGSEQARLLATMGYRLRLGCTISLGGGWSFLLRIWRMSVPCPKGGATIAGNLASPRPMVRNASTTAAAAVSLQPAPRVTHVRGTPVEAARARPWIEPVKRAAEQRAARNEKPAAGSWLAQQQRAGAVKQRRVMRLHGGAGQRKSRVMSAPRPRAQSGIAPELQLFGGQSAGLFSASSGRLLAVYTICVVVMLYVHIYGFLVCRYARSLGLAARQNTPAIDGAIYRPNGTSYQLQPSFHTIDGTGADGPRSRAGEEFY